MPPSTLQEQLIRDEGMRLKPYVDSVGKTSIGVGRNLSDVGISQAEALILLAGDIKNAEDRLEQELPWTGGLDNVRHAALVGMTFNMGIGRLLQFQDFLSAMARGDYKAASVAMLDSLWAKQVGVRALRLSVQIATGIWQ